jgi:IS30 family transposase
VPDRGGGIQTFLPYPDFRASALVLDCRRLGKQRVEALQVLRGLVVPGYGWRRHPAVLMWAGYEEALVRCGLEVCKLWREKGHQDRCAATLIADLLAFRPDASVRHQTVLAAAGELPPQIAHRLKFDFPEDETMRISHEAIYQALYVQSRGALKRELVACLRTGRALRIPRARSRRRPGGHVTPDVVISERPAEAEDRAVPGHWEGDLIIGTDRSAIGTLVERTTRFTMLVHLPRMEGHGIEPRTKNGPALGGYGAEAMKEALAARITTLPEQLRRSLTWDRGKELAQHAQLTIDTGLPVYFADPRSPWQRGTNENTNGLLRQYFPKGTDLSRWHMDEIDAVAIALNSRPRKTLGWKTPAEALNEHLLSAQETGVATTG